MATMNDAEYQELQIAAQRRPLTLGEETALQAYLVAHPQAQADWATDLALNQVLRRLPDAPLSSNFTARVLEAAAREERAARDRGGWTWWLRLGVWRWPAHAALAGVVACACLLSYQQYRSVARARLAESLITVFGVASLPTEVLRNADAIAHAPPEVDEVLLTALE